MCPFNVLQWSLGLSPRGDYTGPWEDKASHWPATQRWGCLPRDPPASAYPALDVGSTDQLWILSLWGKCFMDCAIKTVLCPWTSPSTLKRCLAQSHFYSLHCPLKSPSDRQDFSSRPLASHHVGTLKVSGPLGLGIHSSKKDDVLEKDTSVRRNRGTIDPSC